MTTLNKGTLLLAVACSALLVGCADEPRPAPKWAKGAFVRSAISQQIGQVVETRCWRTEPQCYYDVRFVGLSMTTNTHLLSSDGEISQEPLTLITLMREFELTDR